MKEKDLCKVLEKVLFPAWALRDLGSLCWAQPGPWVNVTLSSPGSGEDQGTAECRVTLWRHVI